ncbi:hypothetical protein CP556_18930 [Natrinema sp. CBA1119]|uniref:hypothetical protein n=1 Tax=Natrinema sp. CBA1119 TaxID=1608465 RepID=UPI000BF67BF7|nr:hypothetical protein [Natrinema sp. CBA1119]PGF17970.1 hypothetical protein CP556_18930 [Natrinema sp. CBA1119]
MLSRRATLQATLSLLAGTFSGCTSSILSNRHPILNCIEIINVDTQSYTVHLRVDYENEEILSDSYTIDGREEDGRVQQQWIPQEWPDKAGQYRVHMRMDTNSDWATIESEEELGEYAIQIAYRIGSDGNGIPFWETIDADDSERDCGESLANQIEIGG